MKNLVGNKWAGLPISIFSFVIFYFISLQSMFLPYSPSKFSTYLIQFCLSFLLIILFVFFGFFYEWKKIGKTSWRMIAEKLPRRIDRTKKMIFFIFAIPVFSFGVTYCLQFWPAYPTKWFAKDVSTVDVFCRSTKMWGGRYRNKVKITVGSINVNTEDNFEFPWPAHASPKCPEVIKLTARSWLFGAYISEIAERDLAEKSMGSDSIDFIKKVPEGFIFNQ
jgi:hypothetical protein